MFLEASSLRRLNSFEQHFAPLQMKFPKIFFPTINPKILHCFLFSQPLTLILRCQTHSGVMVCLCSRSWFSTRILWFSQMPYSLFGTTQNCYFFLGSDSDVRQVALARSRQAESQTQGWHFQNHTPLSETYNQNLEQQYKGNCLSTRGGHTEIKA